jgi:hypothetical protein
MVGKDSAYYRERAEECRELAERSVSPLDKESWQRLADERRKLADDAERRENQNPR